MLLLQKETPVSIIRHKARHASEPGWTWQWQNKFSLTSRVNFP